MRSYKSFAGKKKGKRFGGLLRCAFFGHCGEREIGELLIIETTLTKQLEIPVSFLGMGRFYIDEGIFDGRFCVLSRQSLGNDGESICLCVSFYLLFFMYTSCIHFSFQYYPYLPTKKG